MPGEISTDGSLTLIHINFHFRGVHLRDGVFQSFFPQSCGSITSWEAQLSPRSRDLTYSINGLVFMLNVFVCFMCPDFQWMLVTIQKLKPTQKSQCLCFHCLPVSSCITTYKKTPPPVPPRTTTKPFISITAQSSTESAQDAYMDGQGQRGDIISQSGLSNSTESLDSMKALTAAIEAANAQIHGPASQHMSSNPATVTTTTTIATVTTEDRKKDHFKKNRCLSIGIQVIASLSVL